MTSLIGNANGLKPHHLNELPLFEKTYLPPDYGDKLISRVYPDGSLYYLTQPRLQEKSNPETEKWNFIATVTQKGIAEIQKILEKCSEVDSEVVHGGNVRGAVIWKIVHFNHIHEVVIAGIPEGKFRIFQELDPIISTNLETVGSH